MSFSDLGIGIGPTFGQGGMLDLDAYLASLSGGFRFNFRKTDRFFQESIGPTLADDVGESIGLALDQRSWGGVSLSVLLSSQSYLLNEPFDVGSGWSVVIGGGTVTGGQLVCDGSATTRWYKDITGLAPGWYEIVGDAVGANRQIVAYDGAAFTTNIGSSATNTIGARMFVKLTTSSTMRIYLYSGTAVAGYWDNVTVRAVPGNHVVIGGATLKPVRQTAGAKFDGTDDNLLSTYLASAGSNFLMARTTVPSSLAASQFVAGSTDGTPNRFILGINSSGKACAGISGDASSVIVGTTDLRNQEADIGVTCNGTTVRLLVNGAVEYEAAQNGSGLPTAVALRIGCFNSNGVATSYYAGYIKECLAGTDYLTLAKFNDIRRALDRAA